jgi:hypothetical protein
MTLKVAKTWDEFLLFSKEEQKSYPVIWKWQLELPWKEEYNPTLYYNKYIKVSPNKITYEYIKSEVQKGNLNANVLNFDDVQPQLNVTIGHALETRNTEYNSVIFSNSKAIESGKIDLPTHTDSNMTDAIYDMCVSGGSYATMMFESNIIYEALPRDGKLQFTDFTSTNPVIRCDRKSSIYIKTDGTELHYTGVCMDPGYIDALIRLSN